MVRTVIASIVAAATCSSALAANTVEMRQIGIGLGREVKVLHGAGSFNTFAGEIVHEFRNGVGLGEQFNGRTMSTYCAEITEGVSPAFITYEVTDDVGTIPVPAMGAARGGAINDMFAMLISTQSEGGFDNDWAAAFQIAVWDVTYDYDAGVGRDSLDVATGDMKTQSTSGASLDAGLLSKIDVYFDAIGVASSEFNVLGFHNESSQDQIVPTPGAIALGSLGLLLVGRRRKN